MKISIRMGSGPLTAGEPELAGEKGGGDGEKYFQSRGHHPRDEKENSTMER